MKKDQTKADLPTSRQGERPPVVAIVGHIDHGKSTLLDYIRRTNVVASEAGGITQHLSAYEAEHPSTGSGQARKITFLDTPGHAAFSAMRSRGLEAADVAILVVSAEDGVKPQTLEALSLLQETKVPYIVAFTKIDKPSANLEKAKLSLLEHSVYLEGMGGDVPFVAVSGKSGEGVPELLDLILLQAELEGLTSNPALPGKGIVIEAYVDPKRGSTATLIVRDGSVRSGEFVVCGDAFASVRIMENFLGKATKEALPGSPVRVIGFSTLPKVGEQWRTVETKKQAEQDVAEARAEALAQAQEKPAASKVAPATATDGEEEVVRTVLPLLIKTDFAGTGEAIAGEIHKLLEKESMQTAAKYLEVRIVGQGVGAITEGDARLAGAGKLPGIIVGFNVKLERDAREAAERLGVKVELFDIIYKLTEWLEAEIEKRRPREKVEEEQATARILKVFSTMRGKVVLGGRVESGTLTKGSHVKVLRRDIEVARGEVTSLQTQKTEVSKVENGQEFGAMIKIHGEPAANDHLVAFNVVEK